MSREVTRLIEITTSDAYLVVCALREPLARAETDLALLVKAARGRLTDDERGELPSTLQGMSDDELGEQANAWETMVSTYRDLVDRFDPDHWGPR